MKIGLKSSVISKFDHSITKSKKSVPNHFWTLLTNFGDHLSSKTMGLFGDCLSRGTNCLGDHLSMGTKFLGTNCPGGPIVLGTKWAGTVCSWGPIVGDQMSGDWMCSRPNEKQPKFLYNIGNCTMAGKKAEPLPLPY